MIFFPDFWRGRFSKKLGLDAGIGSWDLKNWIPRRKLRVESYSQVETLKSRSKYLKVMFELVLDPALFLLIHSLGQKPIKHV